MDIALILLNVMGFLKKVGKGIKKAGKGVAKGTTKVAKGTVKVVKKTGGFIVDTTLFLPMLPFKNAMKSALKDNGFAAPNDNSELLASFAKNILGKKFYDDDYDKNELAPVLIPSLIQATISFFKMIKAKKDNGEKLSKTEAKLVEIADKGVEEFKGAAIEKVDNSIGSFIRKHGIKIVGGIAVIIVLIVLFKKIGNKKSV